MSDRTQTHPLIGPLIERLNQITGAQWEHIEPWDVSLTIEIDGRCYRYTHPVRLMALDADPVAYALNLLEDSKRRMREAMLSLKNLTQDVKRQRVEKIALDPILLELSWRLGESVSAIEPKFRLWVQTQACSSLEGAAQLKLKAMAGHPMPWDTPNA